jgi:uncharacterized protein YoxC
MILQSAEVIVPLLETFGFPIVAFLLMYKFAVDTVKENTKSINKTGKETTKAIQQNTEAIEQLFQKMESMDSSLSELERQKRDARSDRAYSNSERNNNG